MVFKKNGSDSNRFKVFEICLLILFCITKEAPGTDPASQLHVSYLIKCEEALILRRQRNIVKPHIKILKIERCTKSGPMKLKRILRQVQFPQKDASYNHRGCLNK